VWLKSFSADVGLHALGRVVSLQPALFVVVCTSSCGGVCMVSWAKMQRLYYDSSLPYTTLIRLIYGFDATLIRVSSEVIPRSGKVSRLCLSTGAASHEDEGLGRAQACAAFIFVRCLAGGLGGSDCAPI
jgi:hypothetical protein